LAGPQPVNLVSNLTLSTRKSKVLTSNTFLFDTLSAIAVSYGTPSKFTFDSLPRLKGLDPKIDSIGMKFQMKIRSGDNVKKTTDPKNKGDYDSTVYKGIEFRYNDTTSTKFSFSDYYAYDDGVAEYAVTLTQPGISLAYQFDMMYNQADTLIAVDLYFPHVGDESNQVVLFKIWDDLSHQQIDSMQLTIQRTENNKFIRVPLTNGIFVKDKFFVGWKQNSTATIGVGFDKNSDSGSKIFYRTAGAWQQNTDLVGNLMIRPVFGNAAVQGPVTAIAEQKLFAYPNPNQGVFYIPQVVQNLQVFDLTGRIISFVQEDSFQSTQVTLSRPGIYLARYFDGAQWRTEKIMVLP
jgi:hypothetical protein